MSRKLLKNLKDQFKNTLILQELDLKSSLDKSLEKLAEIAQAEAEFIDMILPAITVQAPPSVPSGSKIHFFTTPGDENSPTETLSQSSEAAEYLSRIMPE
jgi:hypothetical protein